MTTDLDAVRKLAEQARIAYEAGQYDNTCLAGEPVFYYPADEGLVPGHIYSMLGMDEYKISQSCEYHFDKWCGEPEEEEDDGLLPL